MQNYVLCIKCDAKIQVSESHLLKWGGGGGGGGGGFFPNFGAKQLVKNHVVHVF